MEAQGRADERGHDGLPEPSAATIFAIAQDYLAEVTVAAERASMAIEAEVRRLNAAAAQTADDSHRTRSVTAAELGAALIGRSDAIRDDCRELLDLVDRGAATQERSAAAQRLPEPEYLDPYESEQADDEAAYVGDAYEDEFFEDESEYSDSDYGYDEEQRDFGGPAPAATPFDRSSTALDAARAEWEAASRGGATGAHASTTPASSGFISQGVRVLVTQMALAGSTPAQIAQRLTDQFQIPDADRVVQDLLAQNV